MSKLRLVLVVKEPVPGAVKTRLGARIGHRQAAQVAQAFLDDMLLRLGGYTPDFTICHAPTELSQRFRERCLDLAPHARFEAQVDGNLGERLRAALAGDGIRLAVGSDSPDLPLNRLDAVVAALRGAADLAVCPASDGGYTVLGLGAGVDSRHLTHGIRWSHAETWADTQRAFAPAPAAEVAGWDDVDEVDDLRALCARLEPGACPATEAWAKANGYLDRG